jgi:hypothetical protein
MKLKEIDTVNRDVFHSVIALFFFFSVTRYCFLHLVVRVFRKHCRT